MRLPGRPSTWVLGVVFLATLVTYAYVRPPPPILSTPGVTATATRTQVPDSRTTPTRTPRPAASATPARTASSAPGAPAPKVSSTLVPSPAPTPSNPGATVTGSPGG